MKKTLLGVIIGLTFLTNVSAQYKNSFYTHVSDSAGYQSYYAIEFLKDGKPVKMHYREAMFVKFNLNRKTIKGRWYFKNYPDTIMVKREDEEDLVIAINSLSTIAFKISDSYTALNTAVSVVTAVTIGHAGLTGKSNDWGKTYPLYNEKWKAGIVIKKETEKEKLKRERTEKENQERLERQQKKSK